MKVISTFKRKQLGDRPESVCCFQNKKEAHKFYEVLHKRLGKFGLKLAEEKSQMIEFGRYAEQNYKRRGKPNTFEFLGFTHYCAKSRKGYFRVKRKTSKKKFRQKVKKFKECIKNIRNKIPQYDIMRKVRSKLIGHYRYYGITDNSDMINKFKNEVTKLLSKWLNRRSQKNSFGFEDFNKYLSLYPLPKPRIYVNIYV